MAMSDEIVVEAKNLTMGYEGRIVMQDLNFQIKRGEVFVILGGSGCGKSTLLKHLIGLYPPMSGESFIKGQCIQEDDNDKKREIMKQFGVLYQSGALFGSLTLEENVSLVLEEHSDLDKAGRKERINEKLALVDLEGFNDYFPSEISGGMKKRAGLARAMALNPDLLFFDEPSAGLDPVSAANLDRLILRLRDEIGATIVIVTHELDSIFSIADKVIFLDKESKRMIASGHPEDLRKNCEHDWVRKFLERDGMMRKENA